MHSGARPSPARDATTLLGHLRRTALVGVFTAALAVAGVALASLYPQIRSQARQQLAHEAHLHQTAVTAFLDQRARIARQVTSRTAIREALAEYHGGERLGTDRILFDLQGLEAVLPGRGAPEGNPEVSLTLRTPSGPRRLGDGAAPSPGTALARAADLAGQGSAGIVTQGGTVAAYHALPRIGGTVVVTADGATPSTALCRRTASSPWPRTADSLSGSASGCCVWPVSTGASAGARAIPR